MNSEHDHLDQVSVKDFGAVGDGVHDDTNAIQAALDSGATKVVIPAGTFAVTDAIKPRSNQEIEIRGTLKLADAKVQTVTADVNAGDKSVSVADAGGFRVGQWLIIIDDESFKWQTRVVGDCGRVAAINGNSLEFEGTFVKSYRADANARIATHPSAILIENAENVTIRGTGTVDGNKDNQLDARPLVMEGCGVRARESIGGVGGEELRAGSCVVSCGPPASMLNIVVEGITVRDASEHNICLIGVVHSRISNTVCSGCRDKNITMLDSRGCRVDGNVASFSEWEDGICFHQRTGNRRILVQGNICEGNPRSGIHVGFMEDEIHLSNNLCLDNGLHIAIDGANCSSTGDACHGGNFKRFGRDVAPGVHFSGRNTRISNLVLTGDRVIQVEIDAESLAWMGGLVQATGERDGNGVVIAKLAGSNTGIPNDILIQGVKFEGLKTGVHISPETKQVRLVENSFENNITDIDGDVHNRR